MKKYMLFVCAACLLTACEKSYIADVGEDDESVVPGDGEHGGEVLWTENDTARFYLQGVELSGVVQTDYPIGVDSPSSLQTAYEIRGCAGAEVCRLAGGLLAE